MKKSELSLIWSTLLSSPIEDGIEYRTWLIKNCPVRVFIGISRSGRRSLMLRESAAAGKSIQRKRLDLRHDVEYGGLILTLLDDSYCDFFDDLICSMYLAICEVDKVDAIATFKSHFLKWSRLFDFDGSSDLDDKTVKGLIGELWVLDSLLSSADKFDVNKILESWQGPYKAPQDFVLEDRLVEVKTIGTSKQKVKINGIDQLSQTQGKGLELLVNVVSPDPDKGHTLKKLVNSIERKVSELGGDPAIIHSALKASSLSHKNLEDYDHLGFVFHRQNIYDVLKTSFPKITLDTKPEAMERADYVLSVPALHPFLISSVELE